MSLSKSKVSFISARSLKWSYSDSLPGKFEKFLKEYNLANFFEKDEWIAVKLHFGSDGAFRPIRTTFIRKVTEALKSIPAKPVVTDTVRIMGLDYLKVASYNGINELSCGAPVVLADGLYGNDCVILETGGSLEKIAVASLIFDIPAMVVMSHCKGHVGAGFGGAIKNVAMGCSSAQHRDLKERNNHKMFYARGHMHACQRVEFTWHEEICTRCFQCVEVCPREAAHFENDKFTINRKLCWSCARCARVCQDGALEHPIPLDQMQRGMSEVCKTILSTFQPNKILYLNFILDVQPECDCMPMADVPIIADQGILISEDIVAIDQATVDIINAAYPLEESLAGDKGVKKGDKILHKVTGVDPTIHIEEAEKLGLGSREYEIIKIH